MALAPCLAQLDVAVLYVANLPDCRHAFPDAITLFAAWQANNRVVAFLGQHLGRAPGARASCPPRPLIQLDVMNHRTHGILRNGSALPGRISACGPLITASPTRRPSGAMMYRFSPSA
jgi:hypothetical protein